MTRTNLIRMGGCALAKRRSQYTQTGLGASCFLNRLHMVQAELWKGILENEARVAWAPFISIMENRKRTERYEVSL